MSMKVRQMEEGLRGNGERVKRGRGEHGGREMEEWKGGGNRKW